MNKQIRFFSGFIGITVIIGVLGLFAARIPERQQEQGKWVAHTYQVMSQLDQLASHVEQADDAEREYLASGKPSYIDAYQANIREIETHLTEIKTLTADNPRQQAQIPVLQKLVNDRLTKLQALIKTRKPAPEQGQTVIENIAVTPLHQEISVLRSEEERLLDIRQADWQTAVNRTRIFFLIVVGALYGIISIAYVAINREALYRSKMLSSEQQRADAQRALAGRMTRVVDIQRDIAFQRLNLQAAMEVITHRAQEITHADGAVVEILEGGDMLYCAASGSAAKHIGLRVKAATSLSGRCVRENKVLRCDDSELDDRVDQEACRRVGLRSMIVVPLVHEGEAVGVLKVTSQVPNGFNADDVATLELMAGVLSATLRDATAAEALHIANQQLSKANDLLEAQMGTLERDNVQLAQMATTDGLTGLKNHRYFQERLVDEYNRARRYRLPLSVIMIDVDHFKSYNDTFGHPAGDTVLKQLAGLLENAARTTDCVARYGGEEFAVILTQTDTEGAKITAERMRKTISELPWPNRGITVSVGLTSMEATTASALSLMETADQALYKSKSEGRDRVTFAASGLDFSGSHS